MKNKLIAIFLFGVILISASSILSSKNTENKYNALLHEKTALSLSYIAKGIEQNVESITYLSEMILSDAIIQENLAVLTENPTPVQKTTASENIYKVLNGYLSFNSYITSISIANENADITISFDASRHGRKQKQALYDFAIQNVGKAAWTHENEDGSGVICVRAIRKIRNLDLTDMAVLIIRIDFNRLIHDVVSVMTRDSTTTIAILSEDKLIYPPNEEHFEAYKEIINKQNRYDIIKIDGKKQFSMNRTISHLGWSYIVFSAYDEIFQSVLFSKLLTILVALFVIGVTIIMSNIFIRNITLLLHENYVSQLLIKDTTIKVLEQQINPHFLFNTLESINWRAKSSGEKEISLMVEALGRLLRNSISEKSDTISLEKELEIVESYIQIQKMRFGERLVFQTDIDTTLLAQTLPKMSIQPLVENAIKYSLEEITEVCTIAVTLKQQNGNIEICIKNNGSYIDTDILQKLKKEEALPHGFGIGLVNIDARIKLIYGQEFGLSFANENDMAIVTIRIPKNGK